MVARIQNSSGRTVPLIIAIVVPFVLLTIVIVGLGGYLSYFNGREAVNDVARTLRNEITNRITDHLETFLNTPRQINTINSKAIKLGLLDARNPKDLEQYFRQQIQVYDSVSSIYFGNTQGGLVNSGHEGATAAQYTIVTDNFRSGPLKKYATDREGNRTDLLVTVKNFDARLREWYKGAVTKGTNTWSRPYILSTGQNVAIAASRPVYDASQHLLGVVSVDIFLTQFSSFLQSLAIGHHGQAFIMERSGLLIATSTEDKLFTLKSTGQKQQRLDGIKSTNPTIRYAIESLHKQFADYNHITSTQNITFELQGKRQLLQITPLTNANGLTWLIGVIIPEADFMTQIMTNNRTTILLCLITLILSIIFGFFTARKITRPILRLNTGALRLAKGEWENEIRDDKQFVEISTLTQSFNRMSRQLRNMLDKLNREISGRKEIEVKLRESKERLIAILQAIPDPLVVYDSNGYPLYLNPSFTKVFGWTQEEFEGTHIPFVPKEEENITREKIVEIYKTGNPVQFETVRLTSGGKKISIHLSAAIIKDVSQNHSGLVVSLTDISGRKKMEDELRHAHKMESIGTLTGGIAHDFNNILSIIIGNSELALESVSPSHPTRLNLEEIKSASLKASGIVKQLLSFSRKTDHHHRPLHIGPIVVDTLNLLRSTIPTSIEIRQNVSLKDKTILADPIQINQIIMNLCINSSHEMDREGGIIEITVDAVNTTPNTNGDESSLPKEYVRLQVSDNGHGIDAEIIDRIFDPYFTTKEIGKGSGMGLAVVHGIVKNHGGTINVENIPGRGVTFTILFPVVNKRPQVTVTDKNSLPTGNETILIVDDEESIVKMTQRMVEQLGYRAEGRTHPQDALQLFKDNPDHFDLIISDMTMPEMTGITLARKIKNIAPDIPIIICTGHNPHSGNENTEETIISAYITKPIFMHDLAKTLRMALEE